MSLVTCPVTIAWATRIMTDNVTGDGYWLGARCKFASANFSLRSPCPCGGLAPALRLEPTTPEDPTMTEVSRSRPKRKRGRKPVLNEDLRKNRVGCRLTDAEAAHVDRLRGRVSRGEWVRRAALGRPPRIVPELNREAWLALARAAANLNQISHHLIVNNSEELPLDEIRAMLDAFRLGLIGAGVNDHESQDW